MREYRKRRWLEGDNCNNVPKRRTKLNAERQHDYRKRKAQGKTQENKTSQASTSTDPAPTPIIYNYNKVNECFPKIVIGNPYGYACNICDRIDVHFLPGADIYSVPLHPDRLWGLSSSLVNGCQWFFPRG
jgi:hypothetical protein